MPGQVRERLGFFAAVAIVLIAAVGVPAKWVFAPAEGSEGGSNALVGSFGGLSDEDRQEARTAVERFTLASAGYDGTDAEEYRRGVEETVTENFWESDGAEAVARGVEVVRAGGAAAQDGGSISGAGSTLVTGLLDWRPTGESAGGVEGVAYRRVEEYPLRRESVGAQELSVVKTDDGSWKVDGAEEAYEPDQAELARLDVPDGEGAEVAAEEREALEEAAEGYVLAAYGYEGEDVEEYRAGVREAVSGREFFDSPGGERVAAEVEKVENRAALSYNAPVRAAGYEWLDVKVVVGDAAEGVAYYGTGGASITYTGELVGLKRGQDGLWRISYGGGRQTVNRDELREIQGGDRSAEEKRELFGDDPPAGEPGETGENGAGVEDGSGLRSYGGEPTEEGV